MFVPNFFIIAKLSLNRNGKKEKKSHDIFIKQDRTVVYYNKI